MGLLDAFKQYLADSMPGGLLNPELSSDNIGRIAQEVNRGLLSSTGIEARDKRRAWNKSKLDAVSGSSDTRGSLDNQAYETAMNMAGMAPMGMIKASGNIAKGLLYPAEYSGRVVTPRINSLPPSTRYDSGGMFGVDASGIGNLRKLDNGDYLATLDPHWMSKTKAKYFVGDNPDELIDAVKKAASNSSKSVDAARTAKIPKEVRASLESEFGKNFTYDISNASGSKSYYITHKPSGTKIRVSDHDLPGYYENTSNIEVGPEDVKNIPLLLKEYLNK